MENKKLKKKPTVLILRHVRVVGPVDVERITAANEIIGIVNLKKKNNNYNNIIRTLAVAAHSSQ